MFEYRGIEPEVLEDLYAAASNEVEARHQKQKWKPLTEENIADVMVALALDPCYAPEMIPYNMRLHNPGWNAIADSYRLESAPNGARLEVKV